MVSDTEVDTICSSTMTNQMLFVLFSPAIALGSILILSCPVEPPGARAGQLAPKLAEVGIDQRCKPNFVAQLSVYLVAATTSASVTVTKLAWTLDSRPRLFGLSTGYLYLQSSSICFVSPASPDEAAKQELLAGQDMDRTRSYFRLTIQWKSDHSDAQLQNIVTSSSSQVRRDTQIESCTNMRCTVPTAQHVRISNTVQLIKRITDRGFCHPEEWHGHSRPPGILDPFLEPRAALLFAGDAASSASPPNLLERLTPSFCGAAVFLVRLFVEPLAPITSFPSPTSLIV